MASADSEPPNAVKTAAKAAGKPAENPADPKAGKAAAAAGKYAQAQALPDATLADDDAPEGDAAATPAGFKAWLAPGRRRWILLGTAVSGMMLLVAVTVIAASLHKAPVEEDTSASDMIAGPAQVIDGGTLIVAGQTLQLEAIDAPPATLMCRDGGYQYRCGDDARRALAIAIGNGPIECVHPRPQAGGRLAALCRNEMGLDVAAIQVESGWAVNDLKKSSRYIAEELRARNNSKGLWRNDFAHPELWRDTSR